MRAISSTIIFMDSESIDGLMVASTKAIGYAIRCMAEVTSAGPTAVNILETTMTTKNKVMEYSRGLMVANIMEHG